MYIVVYKLCKVNKKKVATCFQRLYGVIKYTDFEYDIINSIICIYIMYIFVVYKLYKVNKFQNDRSDLLSTTIWGNRLC